MIPEFWGHEPLPLYEARTTQRMQHTYQVVRCFCTQTVYHHVVPGQLKVMPDAFWQEVLPNRVGEVGSHENCTAQIQDFNIQVHSSFTLYVRAVKLFKVIFHNKSVIYKDASQHIKLNYNLIRY